MTAVTTQPSDPMVGTKPFGPRRVAHRQPPRHALLRYTLVSGGSGATEFVRGLTFWDLGQNGRLLGDEEAVNSKDLATQAINAILPQLEENHEWSEDFVKSCGLHAGFVTELNRAATAHRMRHNTLLDGGSFENPDISTFSNDRRYLIYYRRMSDNDRPTFVIVYDVETGEEV